MITKFKLFNDGLVPKNMDITYGDSKELGKLDIEIKDYFMNKYPTKNIKMLGRYGHKLNKTALERLLKFARKNNDKTLFDLVQTYFSTHNAFISDPEMFRKSIKYNL